LNQSQRRAGKREKEVKIGLKDLVVFTRQFATMIRAGIPVTFALDTLSHQPENPNLGQVVARVSKMVGEGHKLSHAMSLFPGVFDSTFQAMVAIGEESGQLDSTLERLADWRERDYELTRQVKGALTYPLFILALTAVLTFFLFYSILPNFLDIFAQMKVELPIYTKVMVAITKASQNPGVWLVMTALGVAIHGLIREQWKSEAGRIRLFNAIHAIPLAGYLVQLTSVSRFAAAVETLMESGLGLQKTLLLGGESSGNPIVIVASRELVNRVKDGEPLSDYIMLRLDLFPPAFGQYVATGEETSQLSRMMGEASRLMDEEVSYKVEALGAALEPMMLGLVAGIVAFVLLSIFTPLYSHIGSLGQ
jgi:type IV pilus assembly protein PilC